VNDADIWKEGYPSSLGRSHGRMDVKLFIRAINNGHEKSVDAIVFCYDAGSRAESVNEVV